jgi:Domain of unknown function (DUF4375)
MNDHLDSLRPIANLVIERYFGAGMSSLSKPQQTFLLVWCFGGEVDNGGFEQFFCNSMGDESLPTVQALYDVGAHEAARLLQRANEVFGPHGPPTDLDQRNEALSNLDEESQLSLELINQEYFLTREDQLLLLEQFVAKNQNAFATDAR